MHDNSKDFLPSLPLSTPSLPLGTGGAKRAAEGRRADGERVKDEDGAGNPGHPTHKPAAEKRERLSRTSSRIGRRHANLFYAILCFSKHTKAPLRTLVYGALTVLLQAADVRDDKRADAVVAGDRTNEDAEPTSRAIANTTMFMEIFILCRQAAVGLRHRLRSKIETHLANLYGARQKEADAGMPYVRPIIDRAPSSNLVAIWYLSTASVVARLPPILGGLGEIDVD